MVVTIVVVVVNVTLILNVGSRYGVGDEEEASSTAAELASRPLLLPT